MQGSEHKKVYSAEDIQQYLAGGLTPLQMNEMEKAALDDPFLTEAMEGYAAAEPGRWEKQLTELKQAFAKQQEGAKIIPLTKKKNTWWKAAAAVLVIGGTATLSYFLVTKKQADSIAQEIVPAKNTQQKEVAVADTSAALIATNTDKDKGFTENGINPPAKEKKTVIKDLTREPVEAAADKDFVYKPSPAGRANMPVTAADDKKAETAAEKTNEETASNNTVNSGANQSNYNVVNTAPANNNTQGYSNTYKKENQTNSGLLSEVKQQPVLNKNFYAQVLSTDNTPLPFANVNIKSENFGTYTDVKGVFRLISNDSVLYAEVKAAGYKPQLVTLKSNVQQNKIILQEDGNDFAEKVVISSNKAKDAVSKRAALIKDSVMNVEPADGWDNYNSYADNNFEIPDDILKNNIHGQVQLSFDVNNKGSITNIKVDKSLCSNCDEAAIRLLQQGPQWKIKKGKKGRGKITVQF